MRPRLEDHGIFKEMPNCMLQKKRQGFPVRPDHCALPGAGCSSNRCRKLQVPNLHPAYRLGQCCRRTQILERIGRDEQIRTVSVNGAFQEGSSFCNESKSSSDKISVCGPILFFLPSSSAKISIISGIRVSGVIGAIGKAILAGISGRQSHKAGSL